MLAGILLCFGMFGCGSNDDEDNSTSNPYPEELFPGLKQEIWYYFKPETREYTHYELFTYEYNALGQRIHGKFHHGGTGVNIDMTYQYDNAGKPTGEQWRSIEPFPPDTGLFKWEDFKWNLTYNYDKNRRITGGHGIGFYDWDFIYTFDAKGRRVQTQFKSESPFAPRFILNHQFDNNGQCILATGKDQENKDMVVVYDY